MKFEEIKKIITENNFQENIFKLCADGYYYDDDIGEEIVGKSKFLEKGLPDFEKADSRTDSDMFYCIVKFNDVFIKLTGWYDSYGGNNHSYYNLITQVFPKEVKKTIYEEING